MTRHTGIYHDCETCFEQASHPSVATCPDCIVRYEADEEDRSIAMKSDIRRLHQQLVQSERIAREVEESLVYEGNDAEGLYAIEEACEHVKLIRLHVVGLLGHLDVAMKLVDEAGE